MFENLGPAELLLIFLVILIFFGPKKIPELAASLGKGLRKFNDAKDGLETQLKTVMKEPLDAINEAKAGLETKLMDASAPLRETLMPPTTQLATASASGAVGSSISTPVGTTTDGVVSTPATSEPALQATPTPKPETPQVPPHEA